MHWRHWLQSIKNKFTPLDEDALALAQYQVFTRQIPLLYFLLLINTWTLAYVFRDAAPHWLGVELLLGISAFSVFRAIGWWNMRDEIPNVAVARRRVRTTVILAWILAPAMAIWSLMLFDYGDMYLKIHVVFMMTAGIMTMTYCLSSSWQAVLALVATVNMIFFGFFIHRDEYQFSAMAIHFLVVTSVMVGMMMYYYRDFVRLIDARSLAERAQNEALLQANRDGLTQLPNRRNFFHTLEGICAESKKNGQRFAVAVLDLDGFKPVNDLYGHAVGDALLVQVGQRIAACVQARAHVARLGGDEFALIMDGLDAQDDAAFVALGQTVCQRLREPFELDGFTLQVGSSMGLVTFPDRAVQAQQLYQCADYALYEGKRGSRGTVSVFSYQHSLRIQRDALIEQALRTADLAQELQVWFQPIVDAPSGRTLGFEALARWDSARLGMVSPGEFIVLAERGSLMNQISQMLLAKALQEMQHWPEHLELSFNLSVQDLASAATMQQLLALIANSGIAPQRLSIEITETAAAHAAAQVQHSIELLRECGCGVVLDDLGTGFSSLTRLLGLPLTKIKIDRQFVRGIDAKVANRKIVASLLNMAREMQLQCVIEGVETPAERLTLLDIGGTFMQGYLWSRPMPAREVARWLADESVRL